MNEHRQYSETQPTFAYIHQHKPASPSPTFTSAWFEIALCKCKMENENHTHSTRSGESSQKNENVSMPLNESTLLASHEIEIDSATPSSEIHKETSQRTGVTQTRFQDLSKHWECYKTRPWNMCILLLLGTAFAIGHHLFYLNLDGKEATEQSLMLRYGTILAFCAKASLGTAAAIAFQQRAWLVIRHKMARLDTVDSIFTANTDIFSLLTWSSIKKAKVGTLIAIYCWITPLVVVLTSETLSVVVGSTVENGTCPNVRTLNFENEKSTYWRDPIIIDDHHLISVSEWNSTTPANLMNSTDPNEFDYWQAPSRPWQDMLASRVALSNEPIVRKETGDEICPGRWNCSYVIDFVAPGYKCETLATGIDSKVRELGQTKAPFNTSVLAPVGDTVYYALNDLGEYGDPQMPSSQLGIPMQPPPYPKNLGALRAEPIMWIGYCTVEDYSKPQPSNKGQKGWDNAYTPVIIGCEHYEVNYTIQFDYVGGIQSHKVLHRDYLRRVLNTTLTSEMDPDRNLTDRTKAVPEENYVYPSNVGEYRLTAAYHSLGYALRHIFNGTTTMPLFDVKSNLLVTPLIDRLNYLPVKNFGEAIIQMYENMIISLLANPSFHVVSWASNGKPSGLGKGGPSTNYPCQKQQYVNVFEYNKVQLLAVYAASIALAIMAVLLGLHAYREEGRMCDMKPSSIIAASRATELHEIGMDGQAKIGYGFIQEGDRSARSFGVEGKLAQLQRLETE